MAKIAWTKLLSFSIAAARQVQTWGGTFLSLQPPPHHGWDAGTGQGPFPVGSTSSQSVFTGNAMGHKGLNPSSQAWGSGIWACWSYIPLQSQQNIPSSHSPQLFSFLHADEVHTIASGAQAGVCTRRHRPEMWLEKIKISIPLPGWAVGCWGSHPCSEPAGPRHGQHVNSALLSTENTKRK